MSGNTWEKGGKCGVWRKFGKKTVIGNIILAVALGTVVILSLWFTRNILMENMNQIGRQLVSGYSSEEQRNLEVYENIMNYGSGYLSGVDSGEDRETTREWLESYFSLTEELVGKKVLDVSVVVNGALIRQGQEQSATGYDYRQTEWYQLAVEAGGQVIFTGLHKSGNSGYPVITIAQKCGGSDNFIVFDIYPDKIRLYANETTMPTGSSFYMCDSDGRIIYEQTKMGEPEDIPEGTEAAREAPEELPDGTELPAEDSTEAVPERVQTSTERIGEQIEYWQDGFSNAGIGGQFNDLFYYTSDGELVAVYAKEMPNGWYAVLTLPNSFFMSDWYTLLKIYVIIFAAVAVLVVIVRLQGTDAQKRAARVDETVHILGNAYFALYRVNIREGTYELVKASDYVRKRLAQTGKYSDFLKVMDEVIVEEMRDEFAQSFSLENIRTLVSKGVRDSGGDFLRWFNGEKLWFNGRILFSPSFSKNEIIICFRMIDEAKRGQLEQQNLLELSVEKASMGVKRQQQFFSSMSHDMRTPLNIIIGMSELAENHTDDPEKVSAYLQKIKYAGRQLLSLINDILDISKLEQAIELEKAPMNLYECARECASVFSTQAKSQGKHFFFYSRMEHEMVYSDMPHMNQMFQNLLSNAIKFTEPGGSIFFAVTEDGTEEANLYTIRVADTGRGMKKEYLEKLFVAYEREKRFEEHAVEGTGLGMPIVKTIVTLMDGEIFVASEPGKGTTFEVKLPLEAAVQEQGTEETEQASAASGFGGEEKISLNGMKILLVEDYELNMELATEILEDCGAVVLQAVNGQEAVDAFAKSEPCEIDAILMDMQMPVMDGCEAARQIRAMERKDAKYVPIIALTANAYAEDIERTRSAGMDAHISKPIDVGVLCETLEKLIKNK